jgi:hypothetical protein
VAERVENIGSRGARHRMRNGWISLFVAGAVIVVLVVVQPPRFYRLLLGIPIGLAALNFIEAREKT